MSGAFWTANALFLIKPNEFACFGETHTAIERQARIRFALCEIRIGLLLRGRIKVGIGTILRVNK
ncbi:hypothetical protein [Edaphovirga cremea]|uniref:hypothetical protein n=1 Tax=Edaphovirga cremea TaxID=2267246 RepID=UPI001300B06F